MENNYILIGLIILTISCIYLFYLNFQKNKEFIVLFKELEHLRNLNQETQNNLLKMDKLSQLENSNVEHSKLNTNDETEVVEDEDNEEELIFDETELEELNNLNNNSNNSTDVKTNLLDETNNIEDLLQVNSELVIDAEDDAGVNGEVDAEVDAEVDGEVDILEELSNELSENRESLNVQSEESNILEDEKVSENQLEVDNLDTMNLKELRLLAKNLKLKNKGNKDELINRIKKHLQS